MEGGAMWFKMWTRGYYFQESDVVSVNTVKFCPLTRIQPEHDTKPQHSSAQEQVNRKHEALDFEGAQKE